MGFLIPNFADILDIIIIAVMLYGIILVIKRSTGVEILSVVILIIILYFLATLYDLKMLKGILQGLQSFWFLVLVIIFSAEIKNGLSQISKNKGIFFIFKNPVKITFSQLLQSVSILSDTKTGALIVFERAQKLDNYISSGETIDAKLSSKLILTIFNTATLLHDGAIIIRNDRIIAVKVVMPLSTNEDFRGKFGTRHLAAIGITEVSDAFCVVVSEQTGRISFTKDKEIKLDLSLEELLQVLNDETKK
ncbi:MAG: diadenylate cyclase CdaA [Candidatus Cloacimonetes bacterium]|nr:diadenylate cyclase CdaA [Candidatus Cloacimonadota bacterium]